MYSQRNPLEEPPCDTCRVVLMEENDDVAAIFLKVRGNVVSVGENIYDLSIPAVKDTMELYPREIDRWECLDRVQRLWHHFNNKDKPE